MDEDSPLLTPEVGAAAAPEPLLTPEAPGPRRPSPGPGPEREETLAGSNGKRKVVEGITAGTFGSAPSAEKYRRIKKVGVGAYGNVFKAENTETKEIVAIKATFRTEDPVWGGFPLSLLREVCILRRVQHPNIVSILEVAQTHKGDPLIVMEFCQASLLELCHSQKHDLSFSEIKYIIRQLLDATGHLHMHGILHRDLATKNVLFNLSGEIKVCDFGISRVGFGQDEHFGYLPAGDLEDPNMIVSLPYRAIELLLGDRKYGPALDVWSVGCIFAEVILCRAGRPQPFFGGDPERPNKTPEMYVEEIFTIMGRPTDDTWPRVKELPLYRTFQSAKVMNARTHKERGDEKMFIRRFFQNGEGKTAHAKYCLTDGFFDLTAGLLALCPTQRVTAKEALAHSFFTTKPMPEWHAWHWDLEQTEIARGDEMRRGASTEDNARKMLKQLSKESPGGGDEKGDSGPPKGSSVLEKWKYEAEKKKQAEERRLAEKKKQAAEEKLPPGWTKHWSGSKQRYYYHDGKTGKNQWHAPPK